MTNIAKQTQYFLGQDQEMIGCCKVECRQNSHKIGFVYASILHTGFARGY